MSRTYWDVINLLPIDIKVYVSKNQSPLKLLKILVSKATHSLKSSELVEGDVLHVMYRGVKICDPHVVKYLHKRIFIGSSTHSSGAGRLQYQTPLGNDLAAITIHNKLYIPIEIWYNDNRVAVLTANDNVGYLGGGGSSLLFDNARQGVNIGDKITFKMRTGKEIYSVYITDVQLLEMYFGVTTSEKR